MEMAWNDKFPAINLYNHPSFDVVDVWVEAVKLGLIPVPEHIRQVILFGKDNNNE